MTVIAGTSGNDVLLANSLSKISGGIDGSSAFGSIFPHISANGRFVTFSTLIPISEFGGVNYHSAIFVKDL
ncbi:MAG: hypothetical protein H7Y60_03265 [Rhodospirillaceae bacterium]|nr:hypothetical protein [Rhodospirillales bacterium]